jgi:dihydrodipicolinate synthase/N-acetylneuraminate lyase
LQLVEVLANSCPTNQGAPSQTTGNLPQLSTLGHGQTQKKQPDLRCGFQAKKEISFMDTNTITPQRLAASVVAVPPLARDSSGKICPTENAKLISYLERGGISTLLYGGNAVLYHIRLSEYRQLLKILVEKSGKTTLVIPSVGPAFGMMMDQAEILKEFDFPTVMVLPQKEIADDQGIARGIRAFVAAYGKPIVLYLKHDRWLKPSTVKSLFDDGLISWIKYAVVLDDPSTDTYLPEITQVVPKNLIVSGIGEQPAIVHMRDFGVNSFTSGCVCVAPSLSMRMLWAIQAGDYAEAESIRGRFRGLEDLRNAIQPIRVLHHAVRAAGIADTGPMLPMLGELTADQEASVKQAAGQLFALENR